MIIMNLHGMLGNQLFQYAYALQLAEENHEDFVLNTTFLPKGKYRLDGIGIKAKNICYGRNIAYLLCNIHTKYHLKASHIGNIFFQTTRIKKDICIKKGRTIILDGYWQGYPYISDVGDQICKTVRAMLQRLGSETCQSMYRHILSTPNAVMVHIRKGDYLATPGALQLYCMIDENYYLRAMDYIQMQYSDAHFFIFSNDQSWVTEHFTIGDNMTIVDCDKTDAETLKLMSACKHSVIANSTFSWWGAYLNSNVDKIVIVPEHWFCNEDDNPHSLYFDTWVRM